jgi:hypothetical protein
VLEEDGEVSGKVWVRGLEVYDRCYIWSVTLSTCTSSRNNITYRISAQSQEHRPAPVSPVAWSAHTSQQLQHKPQRRRKASIPWWRLNGGKISKERLHLHRNHPRGLPRTLIPAEHASHILLSSLCTCPHHTLRELRHPMIVSSPVSIILSPIVYPSRGRSTSRYSLQQPHVSQSSATFQPSPATTASNTVRARINAVRRKQESCSEAMSLHAEQSRLLVGWPLRQWRTMLCSRGAEASDRWCTGRSAVS